MPITIVHAKTDEQIAACFPAMKVLRPHLEESSFIPTVHKQQEEGYRLLYLEADGLVTSAAVYRFQHFLAWGKVLYIDDLITLPTEKRKGYAGQLLDWLIAEGRNQNCDSVHLDSGYQRQDAHRLYLNKGFILACHHFAIDLRTQNSQGHDAS